MTVLKTEFTIQLKAGASFVKIRPLFTFDSKNLLLAAGSNIKVINVASGDCVRTLRAHSSSVIGLQVNPQNHTQLVSCSRDGAIITWDILDGIALKRYQLQGDVESFYAPARHEPMFVVQFKANENDYQLRRVRINNGTKCNTRFVMKNISPSEHSVAFGYQGEIVTSVKENTLQVFNLTNTNFKSYKSQCNLICVACHPTDYVLATGDETGRIIVWSNIFDQYNVCRSIYHWHTLPIGDLCFSQEGNYLYSGGGECVLVKWNLQRENREFMPRLGMPICHLVNAPDNAYLSVSHMDNGVSLISPQQQVVQYIQGLSQGHPWSCPGNLVAPTGLLFDPRSRALVLSGRPGHLQFYSLEHDKQLFSLDVVGQNFLTQERNRLIYNTQVEKAALDSSGTWMSTVQRFDDGITSPEISLKVWKYDGLLQTYSLNTTVLLPHYKNVNSLKFRPKIDEKAPLFVTTSEDKKFKMWRLETTTEGTTKYESWICDSLGHFRESCPSEASFNSDGSILVVAFELSLTLWNPSPLILNAVLSHPLQKQSIGQVFFGFGDCAHLIVSRCCERVCVWDSNTKSPKWTAELATTQLAADTLSEYMAVFSKDHTLYVFKPSSADISYVKTDVSSSNVIAAAFIPHTESQDDPSTSWQTQSQLYFLNSQQELLTLLNIEEQDDLTKMTSEEENYPQPERVSHGTSFAALMSRKKKKSTDTAANQQHHTTRGLVGAKEIRELMEIPSHVMPPLRSLCANFMRSLLITKDKN